MQEIDFYLVDAFSDRAFGGNAAAVCPLEEWLPDETLLKMAQQHNQSETAFFVRTDDGFELRWFTTLHEINLCGHATLAASHVIFEYLDYHKLLSLVPLHREYTRTQCELHELYQPSVI